jgi:hypothetical protein
MLIVKALSYIKKYILYKAAKGSSLAVI